MRTITPPETTPLRVIPTVYTGIPVSKYGHNTRPRGAVVTTLSSVWASLPPARSMKPPMLHIPRSCPPKKPAPLPRARLQARRKPEAASPPVTPPAVRRTSRSLNAKDQVTRLAWALVDSSWSDDSDSDSSSGPAVPASRRSDVLAPAAPLRFDSSSSSSSSDGGGSDASDDDDDVCERGFGVVAGAGAGAGAAADACVDTIAAIDGAFPPDSTASCPCAGCCSDSPLWLHPALPVTFPGLTHPVTMAVAVESATACHLQLEDTATGTRYFTWLTADEVHASTNGALTVDDVVELLHALAAAAHAVHATGQLPAGCPITDFKLSFTLTAAGCCVLHMALTEPYVTAECSHLVIAVPEASCLLVSSLQSRLNRLQYVLANHGNAALFESSRTKSTQQLQQLLLAPKTKPEPKPEPEPKPKPKPKPTHVLQFLSRG